MKKPIPLACVMDRETLDTHAATVWAKRAQYEGDRFVRWYVAANRFGLVLFACGKRQDGREVTISKLIGRIL